MINLSIPGFKSCPVICSFLGDCSQFQVKVWRNCFRIERCTLIAVISSKWHWFPLNVLFPQMVQPVCAHKSIRCENQLKCKFLSDLTATLSENMFVRHAVQLLKDPFEIAGFLWKFFQSFEEICRCVENHRLISVPCFYDVWYFAEVQDKWQRSFDRWWEIEKYEFDVNFNMEPLYHRKIWMLP